MGDSPGCKTSGFRGQAANNRATGYYEFHRGSTFDSLSLAPVGVKLGLVGNMFIAAFILVISVAATVQFAVLSWRAGLLRLAAEPLPSEVDSSVTSTLNLLQSQDFSGILAIQGLCPDLSRGNAPGLGSVRLYYKVLQSLSALAGAILPMAPSSGWAQSEMALCTRYATVVLSQRVQRNRALRADSWMY